MVNKKILITGSEGFIGSHLTETLVKKGYSVKAFVLYNSFNSWGWLDEIDPQVKKEIDVVLGDIRDAQIVKEAMQGCEAVLNLASLIAIPYSYGAPTSYVDTNIRGVLNVVQSAKELGLKKVIQTSTSEVYGTALTVPITEEHPLQGQSPYSASKIGADAIAMSYYFSFKTPVTILRPFNTYGPRQSIRAVIPTIILQLLKDPKNLMLGDHTPTRDFSYVSDIVSGFIKALEHDDIAGQTINLSSNFEISIWDCVKCISELIGVEIKISRDENRMRPEMSEVRRLMGDNSKAKKLLEWEPQFSSMSGFKKGISETIDWFKNPKNLKKYKSENYSF